jgi:hypothetical protein
MILDQIDALTRQIDQLSARASELITQILPPRRPAARFRDLWPGYYDERISAERKIRSHVRQLEALGLAVTITPPRTPPNTSTASRQRPSPSHRPGSACR